jgi:hypothetical protein
MPVKMAFVNVGGTNSNHKTLNVYREDRTHVRTHSQITSVSRLLLQTGISAEGGYKRIIILSPFGSIRNYTLHDYTSIQRNLHQV